MISIKIGIMDDIRDIQVKNGIVMAAEISSAKIGWRYVFTIGESQILDDIEKYFRYKFKYPTVA